MILVTTENAKIGLKVKKVENFRWSDQGRYSKFGTIIEDYGYYPKNKNYDWVRVKWQEGEIHNYQLDRDLLVYEEKTNIELIAL